MYCGEKYVENIDNERAHYECLTNKTCSNMIRWLGGEIKTMREEYEKDY